MKATPGLANYERFMGPMLDVLRELGGAGRSVEVKDALYKLFDASESEQQERSKGGSLRLGTQIDFARFYLAKGGFIDSSRRGVWVLTDKGRQAQLSPEEVKRLSREINAAYYANTRTESGDAAVADAMESAVPGDHRAALLRTLKSLPPAGFEQLCGRLLRELDFENVVITGRTGDGGIDGYGTLRVSKLLPTQVVFQCKRYADSVGTSVVRDFRGALAGRAERGILLTTGFFTTAAKQEAARGGTALQIELIDGDRLAALFEELELGVVARTTYDVDESFFDAYRRR